MKPKISSERSVRLAITGFMGVGKSSVARHLSNLLHCSRIDLDASIEVSSETTIAKYIDEYGLDAYRKIETELLFRELESTGPLILSLGGGTWTVSENRDAIRNAGFTTVWLESTFEHCWYNIRHSRKDRPLARSKDRALSLFEERQKDYCLAEVHFVIRPEYNSYDIASHLVEQIF